MRSSAERPPNRRALFGLRIHSSARPDTGKIYEQGYENYTAFTIGGPVVIPKVVNGRNKLFFFGNYQRNYDNAPAQSTPTSTVPANAKHLNGDFSDLLALPNGSQYQIYDPLTVRPDPARPGSFIRTPTCAMTSPPRSLAVPMTILGLTRSASWVIACAHADGAYSASRGSSATCNAPTP